MTTTDQEAERRQRLGVELLRAGKLEEGVAEMAAAVDLRPLGAHLRVNHALALLMAGRASEALGAADTALQLEPGLAEAHGGRADALSALGRTEDALAAYEQAVALNPRLTRAHLGAGAALARLGRLEAALERYERVLQAAPEASHALAAAGALLVQLGRPAEARDHLVPAAALAPGAELFGNLSAALLALGDHAGALSAADRALDLRDGLSSSLVSLVGTNRAAALLGLERLDEAVAEATLAIDADERNALAYNVRGSAALALGRPEPAIEDFSRAIQAGEGVLPPPRVAEFLLNRALTRLQVGDFRRGWVDYQARWRVPGFVATADVSDAAREALALGLRPQDFEGRRILVVSEQGVGDQLMFASMLPDVLARARSADFVCQRKLAALVANGFPNLQVFAGRATTPTDLSSYDVVVASGDLGQAFRNAPEDFPGTAYVAPRRTVVEAWADRLGPRTKRLRLGLSWRGGAAGTNGARRSMDLLDLRRLLSNPDCEFVSLQFGDTAADIAAVQETLGVPVRHFAPEEIEDLEDLAGLVLNLDLVVTVQNTNVHLCGALGHPCLALVPFSAEWRYAAKSKAMPWYRSVQILRQDRRGLWDPVIEEAVAAVSVLAGGPEGG